VPTATLERAATTPRTENAESKEWEASAGPLGTTSTARLEKAAFVYQGLGDPHWRGQGCYLSTEAQAYRDKRLVIMACGCQAAVPWWTLQRAS
jgi:hypothetical protein